MNPRALIQTAFALLIASTLASCGFEGDDLQDRRCENDSACHARFGDDYTCLAAKYCAKVTFVCEEDSECDDGTFCNGPETCDPSSDAASEEGCVPADAAAFLDDGVVCTTDYCDEEVRRLIHDPSGCGCANDSQCAELNTDPCKSSTCGANFTCTTVTLAPFELCDDGVVCTEGTFCNEEGRCIFDAQAEVPSIEVDANCDDNIFCNGVETCDILTSTDPLTGCIPGTPPTEDAADQIDCTVTFCDEETEQVFQDPSNCECQVPEDCQIGTCDVYFCSESTNFACVQDPLGTFLAPGSSCSDGFSCTANDVCTEEGACVGRSVNLICDAECGGTCDPESGSADLSSGCVCL